MQRGRVHEYGLRSVRRGLTDRERSTAIVTVTLCNAVNTSVIAGPFPASWDAEWGGFVAQLPARTEAPGTRFTLRERLEVGVQPHEDTVTIELV